MPYSSITTFYRETSEISNHLSQKQRVLSKMLAAPSLKPSREPIIATTYGVQPEKESLLGGGQTMCPLKVFLYT